MSNKKFYVTTPIYYVTARPHLGSLYSTVLADVCARWNKLQGKKTFFLTGTDEHGQKVAQAAKEAGKEPKVFVDSFIDVYKKIWRDYELSYNDFIRTTDSRHEDAVQAWIKKVQKTGDIYKAYYEGWYCIHCEAYLTETDYDRSLTYKPDQGPACPLCKRPTSFTSEEAYFFKLSAYQDKLLKFYKENPDFITPRERFQEVISFVKAGLKDLSISRTTVKWGIPFPNDPSHTCYVWVDALINYISAIGYGQSNKKKEFDFWWPADLHILGKDIVRFHAVYWPAFLMSANLKLPKQLLVHGWITICGKKMSKSLANIVDPEILYEKYGAEPIRYYLLRQIPVTQDGDFCLEDLEQRITSDLANDLGNLVNRMLMLAQKNNVSTIAVQTNWSEAALKLREEAWNMIDDVEKYMEDYLFHMALARIWKFIAHVNAYFHAQEPWKLAKKDLGQFIEVLSATCHSLHTIAFLLWPTMPSKMEELISALGFSFDVEHNIITNLKLNRWTEEFKLTFIPALFEKVILESKEKQGSRECTQQGSAKEQESTIPIDVAAQIELRVGTIENCEEIPKSDKLLKLTVNFGPKGVRTVLAGVKKWYQPDDLIGKQAVFIYNLKPRKMLGMESHGMMLFAESEKGRLEYITPTTSVPDGTKLR